MFSTVSKFPVIDYNEISDRIADEVRRKVDASTESVATRCLLCDREIEVIIFDMRLHICEDCKNAVAWAKHQMNMEK